MKLTTILTLGVAVFATTQQAIAQCTFSTGAGSAVTIVDRSANFDSLTSGVSLSGYTEGGLIISTPQTAYPTLPNSFNGAGNGSACYYPNSGVNAWVTIQTTDAKPIFDAEFLYGNGYASDSVTIYWETIKSSVVVSSGQTVLNRGTILGFSDPNGFDQLLASASLANSPIITDAIAIDNLKVQLVPVPEPTTATLALLGAGVLALSKPFRRK